MKHSVVLDLNKCRGCTTCVKNCPTEAIRVRQGKAVILGERCIDCGTCLRICPHKAAKTVSDDFSRLKDFKYKVALPEPALYGQFQRLSDLDTILNGLLAIGFDDVWEVGRAGELLASNVRQLEQQRCPDDKHPLISSGCPAVVKLIRLRFPKLLSHVGEVMMPAEIAALAARREAVERTGLDPSEIGIFLISPCPAKVTVAHSPEWLSRKLIDGAFSISDIYLRLLGPMRDLQEVKPMSRVGKVGVNWAMLSGESKSRPDENYLAVDGITNVIRMLEELEDDRHPDADFIELNACTQGCLGGCLNVENPFAAKMHIQHLREPLPQFGQRYPMETQVLEEIWHDRKLQYEPVFELDQDRAAAIEKMFRIDELERKLPGLDCGSCGAPSCHAHAEDVVLGRASEGDCIFRLRDRVHGILSDGDAEECLPLPFRRGRKTNY